MPGVQQRRGMHAGGVAVVGDHHALPAASPSSFTTQAGWPAGGPNRSSAASRWAGLSTVSHSAVRTPRRGHHVPGEGLGTLDPGGVPGGPEAGDARGADGVGDTEHQRHLRADDHQVGADPQPVRSPPRRR